MKYLAFNHKCVLRALVVLIGLSFLAGCNNANQKPPASNVYVAERIGSEVLQEEVRETGVIFVPFSSRENNPISIYVNDILLATHYKGYARLPLFPGNYRLKMQYSTGGSFETDFNVKRGEALYFVQGGFMKIGALEVSTKEEFESVITRLGEAPRANKMVKLSTPIHKFLPSEKASLVGSCLNSGNLVDCDAVSNDVPEELLDIASRKKIEDIFRREKSRLAAEEQKKEFEATLPKDVLRDKYMLALSDALSNKQFDKAIPVFEKIQSMQMPLDPDFYYFYGESLYETGKKEEALRVISKYIRTNGKQAQFYQESLQLLNKIQASM